MKILYTCITNGYDALADYLVPQGWRAICFTDMQIESRTWEVVEIEPREKIFREIKICPHRFLPHHEQSVWIDGNITPLVNLDEFVKEKNGYWLMEHPERMCIYKEAVAVLNKKKDSWEVVAAQMQQYFKYGYPFLNGLSATGVMVRDNTQEHQEFGEQWWREVRDHSVRDQLSFNYVAWKTGLAFKQFKFLDGFNKNRHHQQADSLSRR